MARRLLILGSTGSIGTQALDIVEGSDEIELVGLSAERSWEPLVEQARTHGVERIALADPDAAARAAEAWTDGEVLTGPEGLMRLVIESGAELVLNALVGSVGLGPTVATLGEGIDLALANKESLVVGGELVIQLAEATGAQIIPVDSEHSALHQLIASERPGTIDKLVLTASGGPFRGRSRADLEGVSVEEALQHPTWVMGGKITIDSATLMNKGLELIEAHHLFGTPYERIDVVVHPQSVVHSYVLLCDGAALAHLGHPDMRVPISYALHYPERVDVPVRAAGPRRDRRADLRAGRQRGLPMPAPGPRGGRRRRDRAVRPQRGQRGRGPRLPQREARLPGHPRDHRDCARAPPGRPHPRLRVAPRGRPRGPSDRVRADRGAHVSWLLAFLGFAALIILHEFGHFAAAKATGMRVERFSLFFPPLLAKIRRGETEYAVGAIPLGGYVKITGMSPHEELSPEVAPRAYLNQPPWKRIVVISAGPAMNLLIAFLLGWAIIAFHGVAVNDLVVDQVQTNSAAVNQLRSGDKVISIDGVPGFERGLTGQQIIDRQLRLRRVVSRHACAGTPTAGCRATTPAKVVVDRDGKRTTLLIAPQYDPAAKRMLLGITYGANEHVGPLHAVTITTSNLWRITRLTTSSIVRIFYSSKARKDVSGVVGSYETTRQSFQFDTVQALSILAIISLSLAVVNLFPFLPLDGGHIFWAVAEKVRGRPIPYRLIERASVVGFMLVAFLFVVGLSNDIGRLTGQGFNVR